MDLEDEIDKKEINILNAQHAIDCIREAIEDVKDFDESMADFWEDDIDTLKKYIKAQEKDIEDLKEQEEYGSENNERIKEFERENII